MQEIHESIVRGPFGHDAMREIVLDASVLVDMYVRKCGMDVSGLFAGVETIARYRCTATGYRYWLPARIAGDEDFYRKLSHAWPSYYRESRWEFSLAHTMLRDASRVLEIGSGRGQFLRSLEGRVPFATGLELNGDAIAHKLTQFPILAESTQTHAARVGESYDAVCSFQVLEHTPAPADFLSSAFACLRPGGVLLLSTPNHSYVPHFQREDAFDLPPHHMGHFDRNVYARLASVFGADLLRVIEERRAPSLETVTPRTESNTTYRLARATSKRLLALAYRLAREPGPNLFAVLRKRPPADR